MSSLGDRRAGLLVLSGRTAENLVKWKKKNVRALAEIVCGNVDYFAYRSSKYITQFFEDCELEQYVHDGSTRATWVADVLGDIIEAENTPISPDSPLVTIIQNVLDPDEAQEGDADRQFAVGALNNVLNREGWSVYYDVDSHPQVRHKPTRFSSESLNPHRAFSQRELRRRESLERFLDTCSEDQLLEDVLSPMLRCLGFARVEVTGHKDKALEYGKDMWFRYALPTQHNLYFGVQAKVGKLDSAGRSKRSNSNIAEIYNQVLMMIGHPIFDLETNRRVLVDHAFIVSAGTITKQAKNWLGEKLDGTQRSQIVFMDRNHILDLFTVTELPVPTMNRDLGTT